MNRKTSAIATLLECNLHFRAEVTLDELASVISQYEATGLFPYNDIPKNIGNIAGAIRKAVGETTFPNVNGRPNPNNGRLCHAKISVGNESSFVLYVQVITNYTANIPFASMRSNLEAVADKFGADEFSIEDGCASFEARFWWD